jgi:hypothetical protein
MAPINLDDLKSLSSQFLSEKQPGDADASLIIGDFVAFVSQRLASGFASVTASPNVDASPKPSCDTSTAPVPVITPASQPPEDRVEEDFHEDQPQETSVTIHGGSEPGPSLSQSHTLFSLKPATKPSTVYPADWQADSLSSQSTSAATAWDNSLLADRATRSSIKRALASRQTYTEEELTGIETTAELKVLFRFTGIASPTVRKEAIRALGVTKVFHNTNEGHVYGRLDGIVAASVFDVTAYLFDNESQFHNLINKTRGLSGKSEHVPGNANRHTIAEPNDHSKIVLRKKPAPPGAFFDGREFLNFVTWKRVSSSKFILVYFPTMHDGAPRCDDFVRGSHSNYIWCRYYA